MKKVIGVDAGGHKVKIVGDEGERSFLSNICEYFERNVDEQHGPDDMVWSYGNRKGFAGTLAAREDEFGGNMFGDSKAHEDAKIRILLALHRYCENGDEIYLVTGQPIGKHTPDEKQKIKDALLGTHVITINDVIKKLHIKGVEVAPEGSAAYWANPAGNDVNIIDIGSGTVNAAAIQDKKHINSKSATFNFGVETTNNKDFEAMARGIIRNTSKKWNKSDNVQICGGSAEMIAKHIKEHYTNAQVLQPQLRIHTSIKILHPVYANAVGFYYLAKGVYK